MVLSGTSCTGKTSLALGLCTEFGHRLVSARDILRQMSPTPLPSRRALQEFGGVLEERTDGEWLANRVASALERPETRVVVDAVRTPVQLARVIRRLAPDPVVHIAMTARLAVLESRFLKRREPEDEALRTLADALRDELTSAESLEHAAELIVDTSDRTPQEVYEFVTAWLASYSSRGNEEAT